MKRNIAVLLVSMVFFSGSIYANESEAIAQAQSAAESWLKLTDTGAYKQSWSDAASIFKQSISQANWAKAVRQARSPLGPMSSRVLKNSTYTRTLPGAPEGEYVVFQYETRFENRVGIETVTPMREEDGGWRVSGYFVR